MSTAHTEDASADCRSWVTQAIGQRMLQVVLCHVQANDRGGNQFFMTAEFVTPRHTAYKQHRAKRCPRDCNRSPDETRMRLRQCNVHCDLQLCINIYTDTRSNPNFMASGRTFVTWNHRIVQPFSRNSVEHPTQWRRPVTGKEASRGEREHDGSRLQHLS